MDPTASASRQASVTLRCDPWGPVIARFAFCAITGAVLSYTSDDIVEGLVGLAIIGIGFWWVFVWLMSSLTVDRANNRVLLDRVTARFSGRESSRVIPRDAIDAVVLTPQLRYGPLLLPNRIELRLKNGEKLPVSNICSMMGGMALQGQQLADAIDCGYEEQERPDKK
ncbi:MAG TPA: hypothetical protein VHY80_20610 [Stellaceae bacterium]|jgi:hypothetical protein|nr:hypothetical protein [Stellaceae bacterium]